MCRGVRQGCSLSGMLYSLSIEPMLCKVRGYIGGLLFKDIVKSHILSAYVDDVIVFVKNEEEKSWKEFLKILEPYQLQKSTRADMEKNGFKYLGVYVGNE